ncbi:MAG: ABC transporter substrate-binding protein [Deltaproteobacteria bacterium]|nr:ABC transporter substrate-binding protein [Deltaproteobacteria bacterium]
MERRAIIALLMALVLAVGMLTCALAQEKKKPLVVGAILSVTGPAAWLGDPEKKTVQMIVDGINKAGGINGYPLEVLIEDDETLEAKAVNAVEKLINKENVLAVFGPSISGSSMAVKPICEKAKVPLVSCAAAEAIVTPLEESTFVFKTPQLDSHVAVRILERMKTMGIDKIGIITSTSAFGQQGRKQLQHYAKQMGIEIVADETYAPKDTDMTAQLKKIDSAGAKAVVNWSIEPAQSLVAKNMKQLGMKAILFQSHGFGNPKYIQAAGEAAEGIIFPAGRLLVAEVLPDDHFQKKVLVEYKTAYEKLYGPPVSTFGGHAYDALWIVVNAIKAKKITPDMDLAKARQLLRDGIEETKDWVGTAGKFNMSPKDHTGLDKDGSLEMLTVDKGGKIIPLSQKK